MDVHGKWIVGAFSYPQTLSLIDSKIQCVFLTGPPQFQYQNEKLPSSQSHPFLVTGFTNSQIREGQLKKPCISIKQSWRLVTFDQSDEET